MADHAVPTFVYDGDCAFCTSCARFIQRRVPTRARVVAWQFADLDALGLTEDACAEAVQWVEPDPGRPVRSGPDAIAALLSSSVLAWRAAGAVLRSAPVRALARPAYRWVARNRHRMPGGTAACAVTPPHRDAARGDGAPAGPASRPTPAAGSVPAEGNSSWRPGAGRTRS